MTAERTEPPYDTSWRGLFAPMHLNPDSGDCFFAWSDVAAALPEQLLDALLEKWEQEPQHRSRGYLQRDGSVTVHIDSYEVRRLTAEFVSGGRVLLPLVQQ